MSVQFGRWNLDGQQPEEEYVQKVSATLAPYGPDNCNVHSKAGLTAIYRAFHTTKESHHEVQPHASPSGAVIMWDGRLDNRKELISELRGGLTPESTDVSIVAAAYDKWADRCPGRLLGDWALSIWNPRSRSLLLAKDPLGIKHLYYSFDRNQITWCTIPDPLVLFAGKTFEICEEYVAGWFAANQPENLTPYLGVHTVPPSSSVTLQPARYGVRQTITKYWDPDPGKKVRYRSDAEYAEHFRALFSTAVQRRLRSDMPILAELSGGLDSSSIVCMADLVMARGQADCPRVDTVSWGDDSYDHLEPQSNEFRWAAKVEEKRGRAGLHLNSREFKARQTPSPKVFGSEFDTGYFAATPAPRNTDPTDLQFQSYMAHMKSHGHRVTFSGIGGGEFTGGFVPDPGPELQNLVARARFIKLFHQVSAWAAKMKKNRLPVLWDAMQYFFRWDASEVDVSSNAWFPSGFVRRNRAALRGYVPSRVKLFGALPSFQENYARLRVLRRLMSSYILVPDLPREARYPYLDRDLLEFLFAVPREQIVGVGKRRYLMKNAIAGLIPDEVLNRRPKDFVPPKEPQDTARESLRWPDWNDPLVAGFLGIIEPRRFFAALLKARRKPEEVPAGLHQALTFESWLRHLIRHKVLASPIPADKKAVSPSLQVQGVHAPPGSRV